MKRSITTLIGTTLILALTSCATLRSGTEDKRTINRVSRVIFWGGMTFVAFSYVESFKTEVNR